MFKTTHSSSWQAFRNHCEYACPLDISRRSYTIEKWLTAIIGFALVLIFWSI